VTGGGVAVGGVGCVGDGGGLPPHPQPMNATSTATCRRCSNERLQRHLAATEGKRLGRH
jgi:hypothetical protein